jgi:hypothetical protein
VSPLFSRRRYGDERRYRLAVAAYGDEQRSLENAGSRNPV